MISVITWDAGFRESLHTVDCFKALQNGAEEYEFLWVDYYGSTNPELAEKFCNFSAGRVVNHGGSGMWHLGRAINAAVKEASGDLLVIPDGDVVVEPDFLSHVAAEHRKFGELVMYVRRWDELPPEAGMQTVNPDLEYLRDHCVLTNPTNYGGCLTISKEMFEKVGGYEENELFSGAGAIGKELYTRLKNAGYAIKWHPTLKIYHPWHEGSSPQSDEYLNKLDLQLKYLEYRDLLVAREANSDVVQEIIDDLKSSAVTAIPPETFLGRLKRKLKSLLEPGS